MKLETVTRIKICGITNLDDALAAVEYGADALGVIAVEGTPRYLTLDQALEIGRALPPFVTRVRVAKERGDYRHTLPRGFNAYQYYSNERQYRIVRGYSNYRAIRAYRIQGAETLDEIEATHAEADAILLDAYHPDKLGGAGVTFDWELAREAKRFGKPVILAGGLTAENVQDAIAAVRPYAVDVSSGVECEPGRKDHAKLRAFIRAVREFDAKHGD